MQIGRIFKAVVLSTSMLTTSCSPGPLHKITWANEVTRTVDTFKKASREILNDKTYTRYGQDTLEIPKDFLQKQGNFLDNLNRKAKSNVPQEITGSYTTTTFITVNKILVPTIQTHYIYKDKYINCKSVINDGILANKNEKRLFVPVDYYGQANPALKK